MIPHFPVIQNTKEEVKEVTLHIYYSVSRHISFYYADGNEGYDYTKGAFSLQKITVFGNRRQMRIISEKTGDFNTDGITYRIEIHGLPFVPKGYEVDNVVNSLPCTSKSQKSILYYSFRIQKNQDFALMFFSSIHCSKKNMEDMETQGDTRRDFIQNEILFLTKNLSVFLSALVPPCPAAGRRVK